MCHPISHLKTINQTYGQHMLNALKYSALCQKASFFFLIHAIIPDVFVDNGSKTIRQIQDILAQQQNKKNR